MKKNIVLFYSCVVSLLFIIAVVLSCVENPAVSTDEGITGAALDTFRITALFPVDQNSITQDSASFSTINWDPVPTAQSYRIFVYDSSDTVVPDHVINSSDNSCTISKYENNRSYFVEVFVSASTMLSDRNYKDTIQGDSLYDSTHLDMGFIHFIFADSNYTDPLIDSITRQGFTLFDPSFLATYGYYFFTDNPDTFSIVLDTTLPQKAFRFIPDDYAMTYKIGFFSYNSPDSVWVKDNENGIIVSWDTVSGEYITKYRAYLRDLNGIVKEYKDTLVLDSINDSVSTVDPVQSAVFNSLVQSNVYKINVATLSVLGAGPFDSIFTAIASDVTYPSFHLPYKYYTTYHTPDSLEGKELVGVPGGIYVMGAAWTEDPSFRAGAIPVHEVVIPSFYLNRFEMTCQEYAQFLNSVNTNIPGAVTFSENKLMFNGVALADTSSETWYITDSFTVESGKERLPVVSLYWHGAAAYCNWRSNAEGLDSCYNSAWECNIYTNGYRLPYEAEFEYVASGAFDGLKQRYPWGLGWDAAKAVAEGKDLDTVGSYASYNEFYHLSGNAMEYVNDFSDYLSGSNQDRSSYYIGCAQKGVVVDPAGPSLGTSRMLRGGSFNSDEKESTAYFRYVNPSNTRLSEFGFRVARNAE